MSSNVDGAVSSVNKLIASVEKLDKSLKALDISKIDSLVASFSKLEESINKSTKSNRILDIAIDKSIELVLVAVAALTTLDKVFGDFIKTLGKFGNDKIQELKKRFEKTGAGSKVKVKKNDTSLKDVKDKIDTGMKNANGKSDGIRTKVWDVLSKRISGVTDKFRNFGNMIRGLKPTSIAIISVLLIALAGVIIYIVSQWDNLGVGFKNTIKILGVLLGIVTSVIGAIQLMSLGMALFNAITGMSPIVFIIMTAIGAMILLFTYIENILGVWNNWMDSMRNSGGIWEFIAECLDKTIGTFLRAIDSVKKNVGGILGNLFGKDNKVQVTTEDTTLQNTVTKISPMPAPIEPMNTHTNRINNIDIMSGNSLISPALINSLPTQNMTALDIMGMENNLDMNYTNSNPIQSISNTNLSTNMQSQKVTNTKASNKNTTFNIQKLSIGSKNMKSADDITNMISRGVMA